jgi:hypothetical protein
MKLQSQGRVQGNDRRLLTGLELINLRGEGMEESPSRPSAGRTKEATTTLMKDLDAKINSTPSSWSSSPSSSCTRSTRAASDTFLNCSSDIMMIERWQVIRSTTNA